MVIQEEVSYTYTALRVTLPAQQLYFSTNKLLVVKKFCRCSQLIVRPPDRPLLFLHSCQFIPVIWFPNTNHHCLARFAGLLLCSKCKHISIAIHLWPWMFHYKAHLHVQQAAAPLDCYHQPTGGFCASVRSRDE